METQTENKQYHINGDCEKLLFKDINGYSVHITDFSFTRDGKTFDVKVQNPGSSGKWFVFPINGKLFTTNNVWASEWVTKKCGPCVSEVMVKKNLNEKPVDTITCIELLHLSKKKQKDLIDHVLKTCV
jgi:hypothetical protein